MTFGQMPSIPELTTNRLHAAAAKADAGRIHEAARRTAAFRGSTDLDNDPAVKAAAALYEQAQCRYEATRIEHIEAVHAPHNPGEQPEAS
jgi:multidrug resistance efflux pump